MIEPVTDGRDRRADHEQDEEQEADGEHHREGEEAAFHHRPEAPAGLGLDVPDGVEGVLEFAENSRGAEQQGAEADDGGPDAAGGP